MADNTSGAYVGIRCMPTVSNKICNFDVVKPPQEPSPVEDQTELVQAMNFAEPNNTGAVCNMKSGKCEECDIASSGSGCVSIDNCSSDCKEHPAKDYLYKCDWDGYKCG